MIANVKSTKGVGDNVLEKTIHKGSESIMFSVLQETQYMYPFKSSVREIVSNSLDSISEKKNALKILDGEIEIDSLFIEKEGEEFKDSKFNADYYDVKWLSQNNKVIIRYIENDTETRDRIQFIDHGVGLGGDRLVNYFSLGFSSKRLSKSQLGSFGLGAKSLLATGVDKYSMTTRYNGKEFSFDIFKDHVVSSTPKFNEDGTENPVEKFYNDFECHYKPTKKMNSVLVEAEVKKHRRQDYVSAVESQLGFIPNIDFLFSDKLFSIVDSKREFANNVVFRADKVLVGDADYYARPQILLKPGDDSDVMINYGPINFDELEMKRYTGNVSFIMNINEVDVTPSRESVIWNTKTRNAIKSMFIEAQKVISDTIKERLKGATCLSDHYAMLEEFKAKNSVAGLSELYKVIDSSDIDVKYKTFNLEEASKEFDKNTSFAMTTTAQQRYAANYQDTDYKSNMSKKYLSFLSPKHNKFTSTFVYIGKTRYKNIAGYMKDEFSVRFANYDNTDINVIYIGEEYIAPFLKSIGITTEQIKNKTLDEDLIRQYADNAYEKLSFERAIIAEVLLGVARGMNVLFREDIDSSKMTALTVKQEQEEGNRWLSAKERALKEGKVSCKRWYGNYRYVQYHSEETITDAMATGDTVVLFRNSDTVAELTSDTYYAEVPKDYIVLGCSADVYKRFVKIDGVMLLTDVLYDIEFGDISLTTFARNINCTLYKLPAISTDMPPYADVKIDVREFKADRRNEARSKKMDTLRLEARAERFGEMPPLEVTKINNNNK